GAHRDLTSFPTRRPSDLQAKRRQQRLARDIQTSSSTMQTTARAAERQEYCCRADADAEAARLRAVSAASHRLAVAVEERLVSGRSEEHTSELQSRGHLVC